MFSLYFTENKGYIYTSEKYGKVKKRVFLSLLSCGSWVRIPTGSHWTIDIYVRFFWNSFFASHTIHTHSTKKAWKTPPEFAVFYCLFRMILPGTFIKYNEQTVHPFIFHTYRNNQWKVKRYRQKKERTIV